MQKFILAGLEIHELSEKEYKVYLVQTDLENQEKSILAEMTITDRSAESKFYASTSKYADVLNATSSKGAELVPVASIDESDGLPFEKFPPFRSLNARTSIIEAGYFWLFDQCAKELEEPDIQVNQDEYHVFARSSRSTLQRSQSKPGGASARPRRSKQNFKLWI